MRRLRQYTTRTNPTSARNLFDDGVQGVESLIDLVHYLLALVDHFGDLFRAGLRQRMNRRLDALQDRTRVGQVLLDGSDFGNGKRAVGEVHAGQQLFDIEVHQRALRGTVDFGQGVGRGVGGRIHGETVLFGTAGFMRKRGVNLPRNLGLKTGVFLSVDGTLIAVFAVKYMPAENVDWALHALHHSRITPVLAVRDGNITPALLKRKFGTDARAVYPKLSTRLALSERGGGRPYALLMREGLMPYAEVVLGSKRLCASTKRCTVLAFLAATASTLLAFYLTFVGAYSVLTPLSLLIYVLLWSLSALVDALLSDRY